jgi:cation diffusion facilitator CzcD-associated flavoprotein CzcO
MSVAEKYDIIRRCKFNQMCLKMEWIESRSVWSCTFQNSVSGEITVREAAVVVSAVGTLDRPSIPEIAGASSFSGQSFHSARWNDSVKMEGKKVIVMGNGASATQFIPKLVQEVGPKGSVTQLVKSAHWWTKRGNPKYSESFKLAMKYIPFAARVYRVFLAWELESTFYSFLMTPNGLARRNKIRKATMDYIENEAPPEYREILKPDYEPGCKRRVNTLDYLKTLHSPNMHLAKDRAIKINERSIETSNGQVYPADVLIYATGFLTQRWLFPMEVKGHNGKDLQTVWEQAGGAEAYKGTVITDFPNFFVLYGPNAATGQHSVIFHSECQINYSCRLLRPVLTKGASTIMVKPEAQKRDLTWVHGKLAGLVFNSGCQSWWMDPVTKKNTFIYPDPMFKYWLRTIFPTWSDFDIKKRGSQDLVRTSNPIKGAMTFLAFNPKLQASTMSLVEGLGRSAKSSFFAIWK